jgi:hypothetical protein
VTAGTVTIGTRYGSGSAGWTQITPSTTDSRFVYVSDTDGNDSNNGLDPTANPTNIGGVGAAGPKKTINAGLALLRDTFPDWLLLKKGDTFLNQVLGSMDGVNGRSDQEPIVVTSYLAPGITSTTPRGTGTGARPIIASTPRFYVYSQGNDQGAHSYGNNIAFVGIEFYNYQRDPNNSSIGGGYVADLSNNGECIRVTYWTYTFWLIEDCKFSFYWINMISFTAPGSNLYIRRNIIVDAYASTLCIPPGSLAQGVYISECTVNPVFEENIVDNNGWNATLTTPASVTISAAAQAVITWTGNKLPQSDVNSIVTFSGSVGGNAAGTQFFVFTNNGTTFKISTTRTTPTYVDTSGGVTSPQNATWVDPSPTDYTHNLYIASYTVSGDPSTLNGPISLQGNIITNDGSGSQFRSGGNVNNNLFALNPYHHNISSPHDYANTLDSNVYLEGIDTPISGASYGWMLGGFGTQAGGDRQNLGTIAITNNIWANSDSANGATVVLVQGTNGISVNNNIAFKWPSAGFSSYTGSIVTLDTLIGGSGYVNAAYYYNVPLTGGSGTGATATFTVSGGAVTVVNLYGGPASPSAEVAGSGYVVGDILSASNTHLGGSGSGFSIRVASLGINTIGTNVIDAAGTNNAVIPPEPFPSPTAASLGSYYSYIGNPGGFPSTTAGFLSACRLQSQDTWNDLLTANAANIYFRARFGEFVHPPHPNLQRTALH